MRLVVEERERLDRFLARRMPNFTRSRLAAFIDEGGVRIEGMATKPGLMVKPGMIVEVAEIADRPAHDLSPIQTPLHVVFEDSEFLVVDKPRGMAAHPAPTLKEPSLVNALLGRGQSLSAGAAPYRPGIVHRLDKDTTGLMAVAKTERAHTDLARQFAEKRAIRIYVAVVAGRLDHGRLTIDAPLARDRKNRFLMGVDPAGKPAVTHICRLGETDSGDLVAVRLETGRTHQIRAHLRAVGHPVRGDRLYAQADIRLGPLQLHAAFLSAMHPISGQRMRFWANPPADFEGRELVSEARIVDIFNPSGEVSGEDG